MVESKDDLDIQVFDGISTALIASAVSCPENLVDELVSFLKEKLGVEIEDFSMEEDGMTD
jgi:4-hydroxy-3-methylbut-2-enyl diphosphate reductase IspH